MDDVGRGGGGGVTRVRNVPVSTLCNIHNLIFNSRISFSNHNGISILAYLTVFIVLFDEVQSIAFRILFFLTPYYFVIFHFFPGIAFSQV